MHQLTTDELTNRPDSPLTDARRAEPALVERHGSGYFLSLSLAEHVLTDPGEA